MKTNIARKMLVLGGICVSLAATTANAMQVKDTWLFDAVSARTPNGGYTSSRPEGYSFTSAGGLTTTVSGWYGDQYGENITDASGFLKHWSGLSLDRPDQREWDDDYGYDGRRTRNDRHAVDNSGYDDFVVFEFSEEVSLHSYSFGWLERDAQSTVMYLDPSVAGTARSTLTGARLDDSGSNSLTTRGWNLLDHFDKPARRSSAQHAAGHESVTVASSVKSKIWAVAAYLVSMDTSQSRWTNGDDGFKLSALSVTRHVSEEVPVPATILLIAFGAVAWRLKRLVNTWGV